MRTLLAVLVVLAGLVSPAMPAAAAGAAPLCKGSRTAELPCYCPDDSSWRNNPFAACRSPITGPSWVTDTGEGSA